LTRFQIVQLSQRSHRVHLVGLNHVGRMRGETMCGRAMSTDRLLIGEHADIPEVRRCSQCNGWYQWEQEKRTDLTNRATADVYANAREMITGEENPWRITLTTNPDPVVRTTIGGDYARGGVVPNPQWGFVVAENKPATEPRPCTCGDPKNKFWDHSPEECSWLGKPAGANY